MSDALFIAVAVFAAGYLCGWIGFRVGVWYTEHITGQLLAELAKLGLLDRDVLEHPEQYVEPKDRS